MNSHPKNQRWPCTRGQLHTFYRYCNSWLYSCVYQFFFFSTQKLIESFILVYLCNISNLELCLFGHIEPPKYNTCICIPCSDSSHWYWRWCITYFHRTGELLCTQCLHEAGVEEERDSHFWKCIHHLEIKLNI